MQRGAGGDLAQAATSSKSAAQANPPKSPIAKGDFSGAPMDLDAFLERATNYSLTISCMAFQDAWNLDMERLRDCCISIMSPEGSLIPFCAYNLTSASGETLYRKRTGSPA